jgi:hypothetical protein
MSNQIVTESKRRCLVAANQISSIMKMVSHVDLTIVGLGRGRYLGNFQTFELTDF